MQAGTSSEAPQSKLGETSGKNEAAPPEKSAVAGEDAGALPGSAPAAGAAGRPRAKRKRYRSSVRSERLLREAFVSLLSEKDLDKITVSDVTRRADLNRGTFYAHYDNMDALLSDVIKVFTEQLYALVDRSIEQDFLSDPEPVLTYVGKFLEKNRSFFTAILMSKNAAAFVDGLHDTILARVQDSICTNGEDQVDMSLLVPAEFTAGGLVSIYKAWLLGKYGDIPAERINALAAECVRLRSPASSSPR